MPQLSRREPANVPGAGKAGLRPPLLSAAEVATRCGVSLRHVRRLIAAGRLPAHRLGRAVRVAEADLGRFLAACRQTGE